MHLVQIDDDSLPPCICWAGSVQRSNEMQSDILASCRIFLAAREAQTSGLSLSLEKALRKAGSCACARLDLQTLSSGQHHGVFVSPG